SITVQEGTMITTDGL
nr:immunoglobulin heavy chain junction region [Mus musculus]